MGNKVENGQIDNEVFVVGQNRFSQFGLGHNNAVNKLVSFNRYNKIISVKDISCGDNNVVITTNDSRYFFAGNSNSGVSGIPLEEYIIYDDGASRTITKCMENICFTELRRDIKIKKIPQL